MDRREVRKKRRQDQVRQEILDAGRKVLLQRGLSGLTLAAVARELQLSKAALYYYFDSKELLVFELVYVGLDNHSKVVGGAVSEASSGTAALAALIRSSAAHYREHMDDLRLAYLVPQVGTSTGAPFSPEMLERIRPFNERMYGSVADKISRDQDAGLIAPTIEGRRLAFLAHTSVLGMLTVEGLVAIADDTPLIHSREAMVEELVNTFSTRLACDGRAIPAAS